MVITALGHVAGSKYNGEGFINGIFVVVVAAFVSAIFLTIASSMPRLAPQEVAWLEKMLPQDMWNYIYIYICTNCWKLTFWFLGRMPCYQAAICSWRPLSTHPWHNLVNICDCSILEV